MQRPAVVRPHPSSINDKLEAGRPVASTSSRSTAESARGAARNSRRRPSRMCPGNEGVGDERDGVHGGRLCAALAGAGELGVRAFVLRSLDASGLPPAVEVAYGDVTDMESLVAAFHGCDAVFHAAAAVEPWRADTSVFHTVRR